MWICPIDGMQNDDSVEICPFCGSPKPQETEAGETTGCCSPCGKSVLVLTDVRTGTRIEIDRDGDVGREGDFNPDAFNGGVSRKHLLVACHEGTWTIRFVGQNASSVFAQGQQTDLRPGMEYPLFGGELLKLARMFFDVAVEPIEPDPDDGPGPDSDETPADLVEGWFVDCPKCGTSFRVADGNQRVRECPTCTDRVDKGLVRRITPRQDSRREGSFIDVD